MLPGRFDQQTPGMGVAGLGDPTEGAGLPGGVLGGHQAEEGADGIASEAAGTPRSGKSHRSRSSCILNQNAELQKAA
jgi:hypothetical protein